MGQAGSTASGAGNSKSDGPATQNQGVKDGPASVAKAQTQVDSRGQSKRPGGDVQTQAATRGQQSWTTSLPSGVRDAMKARTKRTLPRGYEERLREYFETAE